MNSRTRESSLATTLIAGLLAACGGGNTGGGNPFSNSPDLTLLSDKQLCDDACARLIGCGVEYDNTCSSNCQQNAPVFLACLRPMPADCNGLALCTFKQYQAVICAGAGGYPAGTATCLQTAMCEGHCNVGNPTVACVCGCIAALDPAKALYSVINAQCAQAHCPACHPATFNGAACNTCAATSCGANPCISN
jgi:hypothetical protein